MWQELPPDSELIRNLLMQLIIFKKPYVGEDERFSAAAQSNCRAEQRATLKWVRMMSSLNQWCNAAGGGWEEGCGAEPEAPSSSSSQEASLCRPVLRAY